MLCTIGICPSNGTFISSVDVKATSAGESRMGCGGPGMGPGEAPIVDKTGRGYLTPTARSRSPQAPEADPHSTAKPHVTT